MLTLAEAMEKIAALEARVADSEELAAFLQREFDRTMTAVALATAHAGVDLGTPEPAPVTGQVLAFPAGRVPRKRVAGGAAARAIPMAAPRRASTPGKAS